ncbi:MAG: hypothetical protein IPQ07_38400 [Myxococcales bacterium]|nr:hypothetical protein [Myxococcales bacterium]
MRVAPNEIGVRQSATSGVLASDLGPGWHWRIPGLHKLIVLPSAYFMLDYTEDDNGPQKPLVIRTKDNNTVELDVSVPLRIKPGEANELVAAGNHLVDPDGRYRYQRLAEETADVGASRGDGHARFGRLLLHRAPARRQREDPRDAQQAARPDARRGRVRARSRGPVPAGVREAAAADPAQRAEQAARCGRAEARGRAADARQLRPGHERAAVAAHAGLGQASGRARARVPGRPARGARVRAGRGARQAGDHACARGRDLARERGEAVRARSRLGRGLVPDRHQEHPGRDARVQEPRHRRGGLARGPAQRRRRCDGGQGPGRVRDQAQRPARLTRRPRVRRLQDGRERRVREDADVQLLRGHPVRAPAALVRRAVHGRAVASSRSIVGATPPASAETSPASASWNVPGRRSASTAHAGVWPIGTTRALPIIDQRPLPATWETSSLTASVVISPSALHARRRAQSNATHSASLARVRRRASRSRRRAAAGNVSSAAIARETAARSCIEGKGAGASGVEITPGRARGSGSTGGGTVHTSSTAVTASGRARLTMVGEGARTSGPGAIHVPATFRDGIW